MLRLEFFGDFAKRFQHYLKQSFNDDDDNDDDNDDDYDDDDDD